MKLQPCSWAAFSMTRFAIFHGSPSPISSNAVLKNSAAWDRFSKPSGIESAVYTLEESIDGFAPLCGIVIVALRLLVIVFEDGDRPLMSKQTGPQVSETTAS